ncbi:WD40 repeat-like protein [Clavulina sp. PMI_390]|nr:WD40 repeat-like protein [Clavulina sp. PMI_390]
MPFVALRRGTITLSGACWPKAYCFSPNGDQLAVGSSDGNIVVYSTSSSTDQKPFHHHTVGQDNLNTVSFTVLQWHSLPWLHGSPLHKTFGTEAGIIAAFADGHLRLPTQQRFLIVPSCEQLRAIESLAVSSDTRRVAATSQQTIVIWGYNNTIDTWQSLVTIDRSPPSDHSLEVIVTAIAFSPTGNLLLAAYVHHGIWFWDPYTGQIIRPLHSKIASRFGWVDIKFENEEAVQAAVFNLRDGFDVYPLWGLATMDARCPSTEDMQVQPVVFSSDGNIVWGAHGTDGGVSAWSSRSGRKLLVLPADGMAPVMGLQHSGPGAAFPMVSTLVCGPSTSTITIWETLETPTAQYQQGYHFRHLRYVMCLSVAVLIVGAVSLTIPLPISARIASILRFWEHDDVVFLGFEPI